MVSFFQFANPHLSLLVFCILLPLAWAMLLDKKFQTRSAFTLSCLLCMCVAGVLHFDRKLDVSRLVKNFCIRMQHLQHTTYAQSCLIWCFIAPAVVTMGVLLLPGKTGKPGIKPVADVKELSHGLT